MLVATNFVSVTLPFDVLENAVGSSKNNLTLWKKLFDLQDKLGLEVDIPHQLIRNRITPFKPTIEVSCVSRLKEVTMDISSV